MKLFASVHRSTRPPHGLALCRCQLAATLTSGTAVLTVAWTIDDAAPDLVTRAKPLRRVGDAEPEVLHGLPVAFQSGACEGSWVPFVPVNVSHTNVSPAPTEIVAVAEPP